MVQILCWKGQSSVLKVEGCDRRQEGGGNGHPFLKIKTLDAAVVSLVTPVRGLVKQRLLGAG